MLKLRKIIYKKYSRATLSINFLLNIFIFLSFSQNLHSAHPNFHYINENDKEILEPFFERLLHTSTWGLTLCGKKPLSSDSFCHLNKFKEKAVLFLPKVFFKGNQSTQWQGWQCWLKYRHLFPSKKFALSYLENQCMTLFLINKIEVIKTVNENQFIFKYTNGEDFTKELCQPNCKYFLNEYYMGILYGFGVDNALAFSSKCCLVNGSCSNQNNLSPFIGFGFRTLDFNSCEAENEKLKHNFNKWYEKLFDKINCSHNLETFIELYTEYNKLSK